MCRKTHSERRAGAIQMPPLFREVIVKVHIDHSSVKRNHVIYYVTANVQFSEEEKAVIRARTLGDHSIAFQTGYLNAPPQAFTNAPPAYEAGLPDSS